MGEFVRADALASTIKWSRFRSRLRDRNWRRYGLMLLAGKMLGLELS